MAEKLQKPPEIPETLTLNALQRHMYAFCEFQGWHTNSVEERFLLLVEEVGELAKAIRHAQKLQMETGNPNKPMPDDAAIRANLSEEFADVLNYVVDLANVMEIDLDAAYRTKVEQLKKRNWISK